jgi:acid phosphatase
MSVILAIAGMLASLILLPTGAASQEFTFNPVADAYVASDNPGSNYGTATTLRVDNSPIVNSYLRFTVSGLGGQNISQASLSIHANSASSAGLIAKSVSDETWGETTITYSNAPPLGNNVATSSAVASGTWVTMDVSAYVTGEGTYSFGVSTPGSTAISLSSRESGANAPRLIVTAGGASTQTATSVVTQTPTRTLVYTLTPTLTSVYTSTPTLTSVYTSTPTLTSIYTSTPTRTSVYTPTPTPTNTLTVSSIRHVFVVVMENKGYNDVWNTSSSPYITSLGNAYARATNYTAITHPSLPNYLDLYGGSNYGITTDCSPSSTCHVNAINLADNLNAKGLTWKGYMESMPSNCDLKTSGKYAPKHDPFVYFDDIRTNTARCDAGVVAYSTLANDLKSASTTPNYVFITPNLCDDMHGCSVSTGDGWLKNNLPAILNSPACLVDKCLLALVWDEDDGDDGNKVLTIFAGSGAKTGGLVSSKAYNHYSLLKTVETIFGLPTQTSQDAAASPMTDMLR